MEIKQIARYETVQNVIRVYETDFRYNGEKLYILESENKVYKKLNTRYCNETQMYSMLNSYKVLEKMFEL